MEELGPELKVELAPRLKGKPQERQRQWIQVSDLGLGAGAAGWQLSRPLSPKPTLHLGPQISDAVYRIVYEQAKAQFEAVLSKLQRARPAMEAVIRTDMDQIITSKEHLASKIRGRQATRHACLGWAGLLGPPVYFKDPCAFHSSDLIC